MSVKTLSKAQFTKQFTKQHGVVDLNHAHLRPELLAALSAAGLKMEDLKKVAGVDGQIKGKKEFDKLFELVDTFDPHTTDRKIHLRDGADGKAVLSAAGELHQAFLSEVKLNRTQAQYAQPGKKPALSQPRLTVDKNALEVPSANRKSEIVLKVTGQNQFDYGEEHGVDGGGACRATAQAVCEEYNKKAHKKPLKLDKPDQAIQVGYAEDKNGRVAVDETQAAIARAYIDKALDAGYPPLVGVSYHDYKRNAGNDDQLTEHWLSIYSRGYDDKGRLFYEYKDPGDGGNTGRFYVDKDTGKLFKEGDRKGKYVGHKDFQMTQVRTYKGLD